MTIERRISVLGRVIRSEAIGQGCYALEEHSALIPRSKHLRVVSQDHVIFTEQSLRNGIKIESLIKEEINKKVLDNSGDIFSRILNVRYHWVPSETQS